MREHVAEAVDDMRQTLQTSAASAKGRLLCIPAVREMLCDGDQTVRELFRHVVVGRKHQLERRRNEEIEKLREERA